MSEKEILLKEDNNKNKASQEVMKMSNIMLKNNSSVNEGNGNKNLNLMRTESSYIEIITPEQLKKWADETTRKRKILTEFIEKNLKEGVDYGKIEMKTKDGKKFTTKSTLFKSGSEKFCSLFNLHPVFEKDEETLSMIKEKNKTVIAYKCKLINRYGIVIAEGRSAVVVEDFTDFELNKAIKIAEKRAQLDAVLRLGLSDFFTQDLDEYGNNRDYTSGKPKQDKTENKYLQQWLNAIKNYQKALGLTDDELNKITKTLVSKEIDKITDIKKLRIIYNALKSKYNHKKELINKLLNLAKELDIDNEILKGMAIEITGKDSLKEMKIEEIEEIYKNLEREKKKLNGENDFESPPPDGEIPDFGNEEAENREGEGLNPDEIPDF